MADDYDRNEGAIRRRGLTAIDAAMLLVIVLLVAQIWLLMATLDAVLDGHTEVALPAAIASALLFVGCYALYRFIANLDARVRGGR